MRHAACTAGLRRRKQADQSDTDAETVQRQFASHGHPSETQGETRESLLEFLDFRAAPPS